MNPYLAICFSSFFWFIATQLYSQIGQRISILRLNFLKSVISLILFSICFIALDLPWPTAEATNLLLLSGFLGFAIGDLFLFTSFSRLGPARTLVITSFEPTIIAIQSFIIFDSPLEQRQWYGLILMFFCIVFLAFDKKNIQKSQNWYLYLFALAGIFFDGLGVVLSKKAFLIDQQLTSVSANSIRISIAVLTLAIVGNFTKKPFGFKGLPKKELGLIFTASFLGTFLALLLFIYAISKSHPAVISALGSMAPIYASFYEHLKRKVWPSTFFILSIVCMIVGVLVLTQII